MPRYALQHITRERLEPIWNRREISITRIAEALGVSRQGISCRAKVLGLPPRGKNYDPQKKGDDALFARM